MENTKQYHGWLALPRHAKMLRQDLGFHLFNLYIALVMDARWHRDNPQIGRIIGTQKEIAARLGLSQSTVSRGVDALYKKNKYYAVKNTRYILLGFFPLFLADVAEKMAKSDYATLNELYAAMHKINAELQQNYALSQEKRGQNDPQRLYSSFKDNLSSSFSNSDTNDEFDKYFRENEIKEDGGGL